MSGFDTSQPIADDSALRDVDGVQSKANQEPAERAAPPAEPDELGDATPGPR